MDLNKKILNLKHDLNALGAQTHLIEDVKFSLKEKRRKKHTGERNVLMISLFGLGEDQKHQTLEAFDRHRQSWLSFPIKERSKHLMIRFQNHIYNFGYWPIPWVSQFRVWPSRLPQRATIETLTYLTEKESKNLEQYILNIRKRKRTVLGPFHNDGFQETKNTLADNRTLKRGHNCTSWIATAPISENNQAFMEDLGATRDFYIGTNPGWWSAWLLSQSQRDTVAIYWDIIPIDQMLKRIDKDGYFEWNFKRM